ncbi:wax ester/triacylglycerol synthase family O-acyltransferase [Streptomyces sp. 135]|uniref:wax ester/triacylglycerol synthase family O-acyltransferase n=1 Tax=Streptomyces sp. 135 TaxID=2838850 RepID=UPI001CBB2286|nr:wax ester/triacylglycerol synthase family O-acyltransferase [Streptomyces sp. 135]
MWRLETHTTSGPSSSCCSFSTGRSTTGPVGGTVRRPNICRGWPRGSRARGGPGAPAGAVPSFDPARHLRRVRAPGKAARAEVLHLAERFGETPFVSARPPWECLVVDRLDHGRSAYILKISRHCRRAAAGELFLRQAAAAP